jgi:hypothetical protein
LLLRRQDPALGVSQWLHDADRVSDEASPSPPHEHHRLQQQRRRRQSRRETADELDEDTDMVHDAVTTLLKDLLQHKRRSLLALTRALEQTRELGPSGGCL